MKTKDDIASLIGVTLQEANIFIQKVNASIPERAPYSKIARILQQLPPEKRTLEEVIAKLGGRLVISLPTVNKGRTQSRKAISPILSPTEVRHSVKEEYAEPIVESHQAFQEEVQSTKEEALQTALTEEQIRYLHKHGIDYIYHITSIENLNKVLRYDILSHNEADRLGLIAEDVSMQDVQERRHNKRDTIYYRCLHDYASLYFCPRNAMLYKRAKYLLKK